MNAQAKLKTVEAVINEIDRTRNIAQRINAAMADVDYVQKEKKAGMNYSIVSHDAVTAKVRPILQKHGIVYYPRDLQVTQNGNRTEAVMTVRFENIDNRSDYIDVASLGYGVDPQDKGPGKAISYAVKYALLKVLGLETGDDPDTVQDNRADHEECHLNNFPVPESPDPKPIGRQRDTDFSPTGLRGAIKVLVRNINGVASVRELDELLELDDAKDVIEQCQRRFPAWWETGEGCPAEFVPLKKLIQQTRNGLRALEPQE